MFLEGEDLSGFVVREELWPFIIIKFKGRKYHGYVRKRKIWCLAFEVYALKTCLERWQMLVPASVYPG